MKVLMITGDKKMRPGHPRFDLQASEVEKLEVMYWGRENFWPRIPEGRFDVVTTQDPFWRGLMGWLIARRLNARLNVQVHADLAAQSTLKHVLAQVVLRHADSVRVVSEKLKAQVVRFGVQASVTVLPVFIDLSRFVNLSRNPSSQKTVLWVGRFESEKDPGQALKVLKEVRTKGIDARLIMLGEGSLHKQLQATAKGLPVEFPGWQDPVPYLSHANVVLSTSREESYGVSIIEALAAGVPVVAPDVGIAREAGAIVVARHALAEAVRGALQSNTPGMLHLQLIPREAWAKEWKASL